MPKTGPTHSDLLGLVSDALGHVQEATMLFADYPSKTGSYPPVWYKKYQKRLNKIEADLIEIEEDLDSVE